MNYPATENFMEQGKQGSLTREACAAETEVGPALVAAPLGVR
jgi:hypothetical protein